MKPTLQIPTGTCKFCGKQFPILKRTKSHCSPKCRVYEHRKRARASVGTVGGVPVAL